MIASRFTYDRNIVRDIARALADMRFQVSTNQLGTVDQLVVAVADAIFIDDAEGGFDFLTRAKAYTGLPERAEHTTHESPLGAPPCQTAQSHSPAT